MIALFLKCLFAFILVLPLLLPAIFYLHAQNPGKTIHMPFSDSTNSPKRFFILGDVGTGDKKQYEVAAAMEERCLSLEKKPDGILLLGDNFYQDGVPSLSDNRWQNMIFTPYGTPCLKDIPLFPALGNHDYKGNIKAQISMSKREKRWLMPHRFYSFSFSDLIHFSVLDTNKMDLCFSKERCTIDFLLDRLAHKEKYKWQVVLGHHPILNSSEKYQNPMLVAANLRSLALGYLLCHKADAYISGHVHLLEHIKDKECGLTHIISGGGGASLYDLKKPSSREGFAAKTHGFVDLTASKSALLFVFVNEKNQVIYEYKKEKKAAAKLTLRKS